MPPAHRHAHLVTTAITERVRSAATLHYKAMGKESLPEVTTEDLLTHLAAQYDALDLDHLRRRRYLLDRAAIHRRLDDASIIRPIR